MKNTRRLAIILKGGLVSEIVTDDPDLENLDVLVIDYDTEGAEPDELMQIPQFGGGVPDAYVHGEPVTPARIVMDSVWYQHNNPEPEWIECDCCGHSHPPGFEGDCRDDNNRRLFPDPPPYDKEST